jgi:hypothetical protein
MSYRFLDGRVIESGSPPPVPLTDEEVRMRLEVLERWVDEIRKHPALSIPPLEP